MIFISKNAKIKKGKWAKSLLRDKKGVLKDSVYTNETII